ncbi:hypothetical protein AB838_08370 [Rhodobacteraceae bacterium (ex Bugula neritina AB1)]|nr:hypothetical protein AB838_08370 [Rhodobacteraceae bacterium (ex Bugula neritina AB1)]
MFEWGGGCLWCLNDAAFKRFDVGPVEESVGLTPQIKERLQQLTEWHDTALNWEYPPDPGSWTKEQYDEFDIAALDVLNKVRLSLGPKYRVFYDQLGYFGKD